MKRKILISGSIILSIILLIGLVIDRYPLLERVLSTRIEYSRKNTPELYLTPNSELILSSVSCPMPLRSRELEVDRFILKFSEDDIKQIKNLSKEDFFPLYLISYNDNKSLIVSPGVPDPDVFIQSSGINDNGIVEYDWFIEKNNITTKRELITFILYSTPDELSIFDDPLTIISKIIAVNFKLTLIPDDAVSSHIIYGDDYMGFYYGNARTAFIHVFDEEDNSYQLRFNSFNKNEIDCVLKQIKYK